ncbi:MAG TPA: hypothetical protein DCY59_06460 [Micrococcaceae bacterium]|nr:hypothetical protein [Micrococcaceae bacterium]
MTFALTITIPAPVMKPVRNRKTGKLSTPSEWLNSNQRKHRMQDAGLVATWRELGRQSALGLPPITVPVRIVAHIWRARNGRYDPNNWNATTKPIVDGLVEAGLLVDDNFNYVIGPDHRHGGKGEPRIVLTITPASATD